MSNNPQRIYGVFSSQEVRKVGTGTTTRKVVSKIFWFVEEMDDGTLSLQSINSNYIPTGQKKTIDKDALLEKYNPEPEFYTTVVYPKIKELDDKVSDADAHRDKGELYSAEFEYDNALKIDADNVRANFGIGLTYLERGESEKATNIFDRLISLEGTYDPKHKHLFNEFGMNLRKSKLLGQAMIYYQKALEINTHDENLYLNIARVYFEQKEIESCYETLIKVLELNPGNEIAIKFSTWLLDKNLITNDQYRALMRASNTPVKKQGAEQAENHDAEETDSDGDETDSTSLNEE